MALGTRVRDMRSPNQYKIFVHHEEKRRAENNESPNKEFRKHKGLLLTNSSPLLVSVTTVSILS